jgi:hypothetical protein
MLIQLVINLSQAARVLVALVVALLREQSAVAGNVPDTCNFTACTYGCSGIACTHEQQILQMRMQARNWQRPRPRAIDSAAAQAGLVSALQLRPGKLPWIEAAQPVSSTAVSAVPSAGAAPVLLPHSADADTAVDAPATVNTSTTATATATAGDSSTTATAGEATNNNNAAAASERKRLHQQWLNVAYWLCNEWVASAERGILLKELDAQLCADNLRVLIHCTPTGAAEEQQQHTTATVAATDATAGEGAAAVAVQRVPLGYVITIADVTVGATVLLGRVTAASAEAQSAAAAAYGNTNNKNTSSDDTQQQQQQQEQQQEQQFTKRPQLVTIERIAQGADGRTEGLRSAAQTPAICGRLSARGILLTDVGQLSLDGYAPTLLDLTSDNGSVSVAFSQYSDGYGLADVAAADLIATVVPERLLRLVETCLHALVSAGASYLPKHPVTPVARLALLLVSRKYSGKKSSERLPCGSRRVTCADVSSDVGSDSDSGSDSETESASSSDTDSSESGEALGLVLPCVRYICHVRTESFQICVLVSNHCGRSSYHTLIVLAPDTIQQCSFTVHACCTPILLLLATRTHYCSL